MNENVDWHVIKDNMIKDTVRFGNNIVLSNGTTWDLWRPFNPK